MGMSCDGPVYGGSATRYITFYIPSRIGRRCKEVSIDMGRISEPIRKEFHPADKKLWNLYQMVTISDRAWCKYKLYRPYLVALARDLKSSVKPCNCVAMENKLVLCAPVFIECIDRIFDACQEAHQIDLVQANYEQAVARFKQELEASERKEKAKSYMPLAATKMLINMIK